MRFLTMILFSLSLVACAVEPYKGPIHPLYGTWKYTGKVCTGPVGSESCAVGSIPSQCAGLVLFDSIYIAKTGDLVSTGGVEYEMDKASNEIFFEGGVIPRLKGTSLDEAVFAFAPGCELQFNK